MNEISMCGTTVHTFTNEDRESSVWGGGWVGQFNSAVSLMIAVEVGVVEG